jgi:hypothetical protein
MYEFEFVARSEVGEGDSITYKLRPGAAFEVDSNSAAANGLYALRFLALFAFLAVTRASYDTLPL